MTHHFNAASWSPALKLASLFSVAVLCGVSYAVYRAMPTLPGFTHNLGLGVPLVSLVVLVGGLFFVVSGFTIDREVLRVERLVTSTTVPLQGLQRIWFDPDACKGSLRVFGNGGLFSFSGWFYSKRLGRYRLFSTSLKHSVVLKFADRVVVISPAAPHSFVEHLHLLNPQVHVGPEESVA